MSPKKRTTKDVESELRKPPPTKVQKSTKAKVLEKGHIYFLYRPKIDTEEVEGVEDVQKVYVVLKPYWHSCKPERKMTLMVLGRKKMPETRKHARYWGFVADAGDDVTEAFKKQTYETKTKGERTVEPSRPVGEGVYEITSHDDGQHGHLIYMLTLPSELYDVQKAFNIEEKASIVLSVKNPDKPSPPQGGLRGNQKAEYPDSLKEIFRDRRFAPMTDTTEFLNYQYCELMLVGATKEVTRELGEAGKELEKLEQKDEEYVEHVGVDQSVYKELEIEKKENPIKPLEGEWA